MAVHGPVPKRSSQVRRKNNPPTDSGPARGVEYEPPPADERWHPVATSLYEAGCRSGQTYFYEASDWALLYLLCENVSRDMKPKVVGITEDGEKIRAVQPINGSTLSAYTKAMQDLLMTEAARRRARIELVRGYAEQGDDGRSARLVSLQDRLRA